MNIVTFSFSNVVAKTNYDRVTSPKVDANNWKDLLNSQTQETKIEDYCFLNKKDKGVKVAAFLPIKFKDDEIFAVLIDKFKGPIEFIECDKVIKEYGDEPTLIVFLAFNLPYYSDMFSIHFYKQNKDDPRFLIRKENFILKMQDDLAGQNICYLNKRYAGALKSFDKNDNIIQDKDVDFFTLNGPNFYEIDAGVFSDEEDPNFIGLIVLNKEQENMLSFEERVVNAEKICSVAKVPDKEDELLETRSYVFPFHLSPEIDEFEFYVYKDEIKEENFQYKHKIKLKIK